MNGKIDGFNWVECDPMKYWSFTASTPQEKRKEIVYDAIFSGDYIGALKVDGYYQRIVKDDEGNCYMIARSRNVKGEVVNKIEWIPHLNPWFDSLPNGTCVLCECYLPGNEGSSKITSILGCLKDKAIARQEAKQKLNLYVFDVMAYNGENLSSIGFEDRISYLEKLPKNKYVQIAKYFEGKELWTRLQEYLANGREGVVIMKKNAPVYFKRTPARVSIKIKKELKETIDAIIIGANPPTKEYRGDHIEDWMYWEDPITKEKFNEKLYYEYQSGDRLLEPITKAYYNNWAGSLVIGIRKDDKIVPIGSLSGLTEDILQNWQSYKGKVIEVAGMEILETGGIRHPKMVRFRDDLTAKDTDWYRYFGDK